MRRATNEGDDMPKEIAVIPWSADPETNLVNILRALEKGLLLQGEPDENGRPRIYEIILPDAPVAHSVYDCAPPLSKRTIVPPKRTPMRGSQAHASPLLGSTPAVK
jgi:hypothetical protein